MSWNASISGVTGYGNNYYQPFQDDLPEEPQTDAEIAHLLEHALNLVAIGGQLYQKGRDRVGIAREEYEHLDRSVSQEKLKLLLQNLYIESALGKLEMQLGALCGLVGSFLFEETVKYKHMARTTRR